MRIRTIRATIFLALLAGVMVYVPAQNARLVRSAESSRECPQPGAKIDLAFIIDRSGSLDEKVQGQTYNVEIEGVRRALLDPGVIPRDGSIGVAVFTFAEQPSLRIRFTEIKSAADAEAIANAVESLKCVSDDTCPHQGSNPGTNCGLALLEANDHLDKSGRSGARRVLLVSTDGGFTDDPFFEVASNQVRQAAAKALVVSEIDAILLGLESGDELNRSNAERIVFPEPKQLTMPPTDALPGAVLPIEPGECNKPGADKSCADLSASQVVKFAEYTRSVLRSPIAQSHVTVNTVDDTPSPVTGGTLSLRQAIDLANINGGATTINFAKTVGTIRPLTPLPALVSPEITIDGINGCKERACAPSVTIDGSLIHTDPAKGERPGDGLLIRSNRDVVRGLRIIRFERAGVAIEPGFPLCDNVGFNRIELNVFENNTKAGVCVIDPPMDQLSAVRHNIGNTISMNNIFGSETPIDLACDGKTPNDPGDLDEGPNTLLNFPDNLSAANTLGDTGTSSGVSLTGQVNGPTAAGATVEIFAITSFRPVPGGRNIDGVNFLTSVTADAAGRFTVTGLADSPTCGYTATVTDLAGNTSELMFPCGGFSQVKIGNIDFQSEAAPNQLPFQTGQSSIENTECGTLNVVVASITRDGFPRKRSDDREHFPFIGISGIGTGIGGHFVVVYSLTAKFNPVIPAVFRGINPPASAILPDTVHSTLTFEHNGCAGSDTKISLTGHVNKSIRLIDPDNPRNDPRVTLSRSGDVFTVVYSIYDSNLDVDRVKYEFFDKNGPVDLNQPEPDLSAYVAKAVADGRLQKGQSFSVMQVFTNAKQHRDVATVTVTVSDKQPSSDKASGSITASTSIASARSSLSARGGLLVLPVARFEGRVNVGAPRLSAIHKKRRS